jgi:restriction endonuclease S subunit
MKGYKKYKKVNIDWVDSIPVNWHECKLKFIAEIVTGNTPPTADRENYEGGEFLWIKPSEINEFIPTNDSKEKLTKVGVKKARILPPLSALVNGIGRIGEFGYSEKEASTNQQINSLVFNNKVNKKFGLYLTFALKDEFLKNSEKVVVPILNKSKMSSIKHPLPPLPEQKNIVAFLDYKTERIDQLIKFKEEKIELLKQKRTALINEAVTKGINPNVALKDSGIEWIGEIPEHWETAKLKFVSEKITDGTHYSPKLIDEGKYYVTVTNITKENDIDFKTCGKISLSDFDSLVESGCRPEIGDVLLTKDGTIGRGLVVEKINDFVILSSIGLIRMKATMNSHFGLYYLLSELNINQMLSNIRGAALTRLTITLISNLFIIIPPLEEQIQIVNYLNQHTQEIDALVKLEEEKMAALKDYRLALISEAVTGKIDVRDWQAPKTN